MVDEGTVCRMKMKVSVIIPVYNVEKYLSKCLESVMRQTLRELEIICVNDGSTDGSGKILKSYQTLDCRIVVISKRNGGLSSARNTGLSKAGGEYVYFLDADDWLAEDALRILYQAAKKQDLDVLYFAGKTVWETQKLKKSHKKLEQDCSRNGLNLPLMTGSQMLVELTAQKKYLVSVCLQFIKRSFLMEKGIAFYEGILHEDNLFTFQVIINAARVRCLGNPLFFRRIRTNSIMTERPDARNCRGYYICYYEVLKYVLLHQKDCSYELQQAQMLVLDELLCSIIRVYKILPREQKAQVMVGHGPVSFHVLDKLVLPSGKLRRLVRNFRENGGMDTAWKILQRIYTCLRLGS